MNAHHLLIGPVGLAIAVVTVAAFIAAMLLPSFRPAPAAPAVSGMAATDVAPAAARKATGRSALGVFASMRWPLVAVTILITTYRIYSLS